MTHRPIKFRGKRIDNGEWVYGFVVITPDRAFILNDVGGFNYEVDPATVGQFTGLFDKAGRDAYEFDYIIPPNDYFYKGKYDGIMIIRNWKGCFIAIDAHDGLGKRSDDLDYIMNDDTTNWCFLYQLEHTYEIIGNIHETELTK